MANRVTGTFSGTGRSSAWAGGGLFTGALTFSGVATVELQRSFTGGQTWLSVHDMDGVKLEYTADVDLNLTSAAPDILWAWYCSAYTDSVAYVLGSGPG